MEFRDSKTYENIKKAYEGELRGSSVYRNAAKQAEQDGFEQIAQIFEETAGHELEHAELMQELINSDVPVSTKENLAAAVRGETAESGGTYPEYAKTAREEGYEQIGELFDSIAAIEGNHGRRFEILLKNIEDGEVFCKDGENWWICRNCGHLHYGKCAPQVCPVCGYPEGYFELYSENY